MLLLLAPKFCCSDGNIALKILQSEQRPSKYLPLPTLSWVFTLILEEVASTDSGVGFNPNYFGTESSDVDTEIDVCGGQ